MLLKREHIFINSAGHRIFVEFIFPKHPARAAVIFCQGLRSYNNGFLSNAALRFVRAGYMAVKFDFVGTSRSEGLFEEKLTPVMLKNLEDVIDATAAQPGIRTIGVFARSNSASLLAIHGKDPRIAACALVAMPVRYFRPFAHWLAAKESRRRGRYLYHPSFKRKHTKGAGRLPIKFFTELKQYEPTVLRNVRHLRNAIHFQSNTDEVLKNDGHFEYLQSHLPQPHKSVIVPNVSHSFLPGKQHIVIRETLQWFKKYLKP